MGRISNLQTTLIEPNKLRVTWNPVNGATGYKVTWRVRDGECLVSQKNSRILPYNGIDFIVFKSCGAGGN